MHICMLYMAFDQQMVIFWHFIMDIFLINMLLKTFHTFFLVIQKHAYEDSFHYILCSCSLVFKVSINNWKLSITCIVRWLFHNCHSFHTMIVQNLSPTSQPGAETQFLGVAVTHINFDIYHSIQSNVALKVEVLILRLTLGDVSWSLGELWHDHLLLVGFLRSTESNSHTACSSVI